jgi:hypothetical protein
MAGTLSTCHTGHRHVHPCSCSPRPTGTGTTTIHHVHAKKQLWLHCCISPVQVVVSGPHLESNLWPQRIRRVGHLHAREQMMDCTT